MFAVCQRVFSKWIVETWTCRSDFEWTVIFLCCWNIVIALKIHQISALKCLLWSFIALGFTIVTQGPKTHRFQLFLLNHVLHCICFKILFTVSKYLVSN